MATKLPQHITHDWLGTLDDDRLLDTEARLHAAFRTLEQAQKRADGERYDLMRGPAPLLAAWDRWSRVHTATRARRLHPRR